MDALTLLRQGPVVPVIVVNAAAVAVDLARALVDGGIRVLEVTLRTKAALAAMRRMRDEVPGAIVGAGTLRNRAQLEGQGKKVRSVGKYEKFAKSLLNPAANDTLYKTPQNQMLEIVLLDNPATVKPGGVMHVQVLLRGKPLPGAAVAAFPNTQIFSPRNLAWRHAP